MIRQRISKQLRLKVSERAEGRCEYCRMHEDDMFLGFEVDHVIAVKHSGSSTFDNLAYCCPHCNQHKGSDIASYVKSTQTIVPLFNPRTQLWQNYFDHDLGKISGKNDIGKVTVNLLQMNAVDLLVLRQLLTELNRFP